MRGEGEGSRVGRCEGRRWEGEGSRVGRCEGDGQG